MGFAGAAEKELVRANKIMGARWVIDVSILCSADFRMIVQHSLCLDQEAIPRTRKEGADGQ